MIQKGLYKTFDTLSSRVYSQVVTGEAGAAPPRNSKARLAVQHWDKNGSLNIGASVMPQQSARVVLPYTFYVV